jgi:hypothetical protein
MLPYLAHSSALKMEEAGSSGILVFTYKITRRHIPGVALSADTDTDPWVWEGDGFIAGSPCTVRRNVSTFETFNGRYLDTNLYPLPNLYPTT